MVDRRDVLTAAGVAGLLATAGGPATAKPGGSGGASRLSTPPEAVVETRHGKVRGAVRDGIFVFKGVPYGKDTSRDARFLPPDAPAAWTGVRPALSYGPRCPQVVRTGWQNSETAFIYDWDDGFAGEDCLKLNVWSPGPGKGARPVMVWLHGGGYEAGSPHELPSCDGERLARRGDLVVVSVAHRLGPFGFLNLSGLGERYAASGNAGMLDLVLALQWVRDNAAAFGGDPRNVTIFGQSGGGGKVGALMAMPAAKGLFHKAIVQSGSQLQVGGPERGLMIAEAVLKALGVTRGDAAAKLATVSAVDLVDAGEAAKKTLPKLPPGDLGMAWQPVVDGAAIPAQTWTPAAPALSAGVPMLIGSCLNEYSPSLGNPALETMGEDRAKAMAQAAGGASPAAWSAFRAAHPQAKPVEVLSMIVSMGFRRAAVTQAQRKAAQGGAPVWLYRFDYNPSTVLDGRVRAFHCAELAYCFDNVDRCLNATGGTAEARTLAGRMADAWIAFARTGDPNHKGLPRWPAVTTGAMPNLLFDAKCAVVDDPDAKERAALAT